MELTSCAVMFLLRNQDFHNFPSFNSFRQDRSGDSAEPQAPIGSGGRAEKWASNFVKATFGRGRGVHRTRLPHPSAERRARRSPEGDVVQIGESINASKDLEDSDRNEEVSGRGPSGQPGGRSGRGRGHGRSERSEEDRDIPKEYRPPREFKGGRGQGQGQGQGQGRRQMIRRSREQAWPSGQRVESGAYCRSDVCMFRCSSYFNSNTREPWTSFIWQQISSHR
jgi:hypothetical protein